MDLLSVIRRWHHREGLAIREIERRTGLSRNTIRKYLASDVVEPKYPPRKSQSKLDPYAETLASWLRKPERGGSSSLTSVSDTRAWKALWRRPVHTTQMWSQ